MNLAVPLRHARELLGREINPTVYVSAEFAKNKGHGKRPLPDGGVDEAQIPPVR